MTVGLGAGARGNVRRLLARVGGVLAIGAVAAGTVGPPSALGALPEFSGRSRLALASSGVVIDVGSTVEQHEQVRCTASTGVGEVLSPRSGHISLTLTGCTSEEGESQCSSPAAAAGEIKTRELEFTLGYVSESEGRVGERVTPVAGGPFADFVCGEYDVVVSGAAVGIVTPTNSRGTTTTVTFSQSEGVQYPSGLEGGSLAVLDLAATGGSEGGGHERASIAFTETVTSSEQEAVAAAEPRRGGPENWKIDGVFLKPGETRQFTASAAGATEFKPIAGPAIECQEAAAEGAVIAAKNTTSAGTSATTAMAFGACNVVEEASCEVEAGPGRDTAVGLIGSELGPSRPTWTLGFQETTFTVGGCAQTGTYVLSGSATAAGPINGTIAFGGPGTTLRLGGEPTALTATYETRLTAGGALEAAESEPGTGKGSGVTPTAYLALGDSIAFGYTEEKFDLNFPSENPSAFEGGYVNVVAKYLAKAEKQAGNALSTINLACPGETSSSMIGHNETLGGSVGPEFDPCAYHNVSGFPLHYVYGPLSQVEAAVGILGGEVPVKAITIDIGSNDEFAVESACERPEYDVEHGFAGGASECIVAEAPALFKRILHNVGDTIATVRTAGYQGPVAVLGYYNARAEVLPGSDALWEGLNVSFEDAISKGEFGPDVRYANPFATFNPQTTREPKAICKYTEECNAHDLEVDKEGDVHPSPLGYKTLGKLVYKAL